MVGELA